MAFLSGCSEDGKEPEVPRPLLVLDTEAIPYLTKNHWIYATDADGNLLGVQKAVRGEVVTLPNTTHAQKFNLTIINGSETPDGKTYASILTYADVESGSTVKGQHGTAGLVLIDPGMVTFKITTYDGPAYGMKFTNPGSHLSYTESIESGTLNADIQLCRLPSDVLLTTYRDGVPVYKMLKNVKDGDHVELDMKRDFTPFEHQRTLDFKGYYSEGTYNEGWVSGAYLDDTRKFIVFPFTLIDTYYLRYTKDWTAHPIIGYVDGFDAYDMRVFNTQPSGYVEYNKQAIDIEESFNSFKIPTFNFKTFSTDIHHFSFQFSEDFTHYTAYFRSFSDAHELSWEIHAPKGADLNVGDIPYEILAEYPMINPDAFKYEGCRLTKIVSGDSYKESILRLWPTQSLEHETYTYSPKFK